MAACSAADHRPGKPPTSQAGSPIPVTSGTSESINWGVGARDSQCISPNGTCVNFASPLQLSKPSGQQKYTRSPPLTTTRQQAPTTAPSGSTIRLAARTANRSSSSHPQAGDYDDGPVTAVVWQCTDADLGNGGASGQPVTFAVTGSSTVCALSGSSGSRHVDERNGLCSSRLANASSPPSRRATHLRCRAQHNAILRRQPSHADGHRVERHLASVPRCRPSPRGTPAS